MSGLRFVVGSISVSHELDYDSAYDEDYYFDDVELIYDLDDLGGFASPSNAGYYAGTLASSSDATPVMLATIHNDLQLLTVTILFIYTVVFVLFIVGKWR